VLLALLYAVVWTKDMGIIRNDAFTNAEVLQASTADLVLEVVVIALVLATAIIAVVKRIGALPRVLGVLAGLFFGVAGYNYVTAAPNAQLADIESAGLPAYNNTILNFSNERNILVFFLDMIPGFSLPGVFEEHPDLTDVLDGFTWYRNAISTSNATLTSTAAVVAGHRYEPLAILNRNDGFYPQFETDTAYLDLTTSLRAQGYAVHFRDAKYLKNQEELTALGATFGKSRDYLPYWSAKTGFKMETFYGRAYRGEMRILFGLASFVVAPHFLKEKLYDSGLLKELFGKYSWVAKRLSVYDIPYWPVLDLLPEISRADNEQPVFFFLYSGVTHNPYSHNVSCEMGYWYTKAEKFGQEDRQLMINSTYCTLDRLGAFFSTLKSAGVYDKSKIIIVSDHGRNSPEYSYKTGSGCPILLVKDFHQTGRMQISDLPISNADVAGIVCSAVEGGCSRIDDTDSTKSPQADTTHYYVHVRLSKSRDERESTHVQVLDVLTGQFPEWTPVKRDSVLKVSKEK